MTVKRERHFRVIDTGIRDGRSNIAFDRALIEARKEDAIPDTIRFLRFRPAALVGVHQILSHEVRLDYCREKNIQVGRRITGGGGLYLDEGQIGWELVFKRTSLGITDLSDLTKRICEAAADGITRMGLAELGLKAGYRPRNDIEVEGRKISGTGGIFDGDVLFYQGTLLIDFDPADMIAALKVPVEKLAKRDLDSARHRVVTLSDLLGDALPPLEKIYECLLAGLADGLGITPEWGEINADEELRSQRAHDEEIGTDEYVTSIDAPETDDSLQSASLTTRGGTLRADIRLEGTNQNIIREALITGDLFVTPTRTVLDLEAALRGKPTDKAGAAVAEFFATGGPGADADLLALTAYDFRNLVEAALRQLTFRIKGGCLLRGHLIGPATNSKPTLVFLHDGLGCARLWRDIPHRLSAATGLGALLYDRQGCGDSSPVADTPPDRNYIREEALSVVPKILKGAGIRDAILIGHSDGGAIALAFAGAYPELVRGVIAESAHLFREDKTLSEIRAQVADFAAGDLRARLERYHGAKAGPTFNRLAEIWLGDGARDWMIDDLVGKISCPVLALRGAEDEYFSAAQNTAIAEAIAGPVECVELENCAHVPHHQARKKTLAAMAEFIERVVEDSCTNGSQE
ncbi:MAG: alpha/beta fold hydrolase [Rhodospirillaceae bacterium]|nr:alpha/beta fold hydrolase [Rhodospirillaceae bacterium]MBT5676193.1 alpha/beta fold hydrolase [Rhodospirillaceae bacterium]MBT5778296.1 alpha/beta fold hydrolase [Rhodospirillaceae bacterium]MBT6830548.1 alpha/beta fold hydrolase [Rhodospirillaceae bacterium]MBT7291310.1 alpha/beta fold hydrolase [Rhodospirillaceae bacterium]